MKTKIFKKLAAPVALLAIFGTIFIGGAPTYAEPDEDQDPEPETIINIPLNFYVSATAGGAFNTQYCESVNGASCDIVISDVVPIGGYRVIGWSETPDDTEADYVAGDTITITPDGKNLYAVFDRNDPAPMPLVYAVNFFIDGVGMVEECSTTSGVPCMFTIPEDSEFGEELSKKDGYKFLGWATTEGATEPEYVAGDEVNILETGTDFFAVWGEESDEEEDEESVKVPDTGMFTGGDNGSEMTIALAALAVSVFAIVAVLIVRKNSRGHYTYK